MADIKLQGNLIHTIGDLPKAGEKAKDFVLVGSKLNDVTLKDYEGKNIILNIFPSLDTAVCANSVRKFNDEASNLKDTVVLCVSKDLPFAHSRFCSVEGLENVVSLSEFRNNEFSKTYGVEIVDGPLKGLMSRAVVVLDKDKNVIYSQQVPEITEEPNYDLALKAIK